MLSSGFLNRSLGPGRFPDDNAGAGRCSMGDPPPDGCIYIGDLLLERLSDEALAGVLAHELGHLERGHRSISPAAKELGVALGGLTYAALVARREREDERETDQAALARLTAAGYCAGPVMQRTFDELAELTLWGRGGGGVLSSHPGYGERVARAGTACGPLRAGWRVIAVEAAGLERLAGGPYEDEATCRAAQALLGLVAPGGRALCVPGHLQKWQLVLVRPPAGFKSAHWQFTSEEHCGSAARISFPSHRFRCERLE